MATKTVILRPTATHLIFLDSWYPADTPREETYKLINETVADDEATYVSSYDILKSPRFYLDFPKGTIISIKVYCRAKAQGTQTLIDRLRVHGYDSNGTEVDYIEATSANGDITGGCLNEWSDYIAIFPSISKLNNSEIIRHTLFLDAGTGEGNSKNGTGAAQVDYTQVYLELTYEEPDPIYIRENNTWTPIEGTIYHKENGAWVESNIDIFNNGDKFTLHQLN